MMRENDIDVNSEPITQPVDQDDIKQKKLPDTSAAIHAAICTLDDAGLSPNFIFSGDSVLHIAALNAFLEKMQNAGIPMCGIVLNSIPPNRVPQFSSEDVVSLPSERFRYIQNGIDCRCEKSGLSAKLVSALENPVKGIHSNQVTAGRNAKESECFYLIWPDHSLPTTELWEAAYSTGKAVRCILVEEGTGSYLSHKSVIRLNAAKAGKGIIYLKSLSKALISGIFERRREKLLHKVSNVERFGTFDISSTGYLSPNKDFAKWMRTSLKKHSALTNSPAAVGRDFSSTIVFIATNFSELGPMDLELRVIEAVAKVVKDCGLKLYVRPHPRTQDTSCYKTLAVEIDHNPKIAFESILASSSSLPLATVGFCSSSQVLANALWDIPAFSVAKILETISCQIRLNTKVIEAYVERVGLFEERFKDCIIQISSEADLKTRLSSLASSTHSKSLPKD